MTLEIASVLAILLGALVLFIGGWIRMDLVALLVLGILAISGLVTPAEALSGFSNPAVVTVWAVFVLSGGLSRTGVARIVGRGVVRVAGQGEVRLLVVIMLTAAFLSAFMNNVGVAALMLPVVMDICRGSGLSPAKLLLPLAYASLLGGLTTLIGTPPNILVADALRDAGLRPFGLFDFTPIGVVVMLGGVAFMTLVGRRLLPGRDPGGEARQAADTRLEDAYGLRDRLFSLRVGRRSALGGKPLADSRLGAALGLNVVAVVRNGETRFAPGPDLVLRADDELLCQGRLDRLLELQGQGELLVPQADAALEGLTSNPIDLVEMRLEPGAPLAGRTLEEADFRVRYELNVVALIREGRTLREDLHGVRLEEGDRLLVQGSRDVLEALESEPGLAIVAADPAEAARLRDRMLAVRVPVGSPLADASLAESRLGDAFGLTVLAILRGGRFHPAPDPEEPLESNDILLVEGEMEDLRTIRALQELEVESGSPVLEELEARGVGLEEAVLAPRSSLAGHTLRQLRFRDKFGLTVLAILRGGRLHRSNLRDLPLRFGDALLLYGPAERLRLLGSEPDFLVLTRAAQPPPRIHRAPVATGIMALVLVPVLFGWLHISIAAVAGAGLMVLTRCLTMEEAYRDIEWQAVFLIAGMLPLGIALEQSGAARLLAEGVLGAIGGFGPLAVMAGLFIITSLGTQVIPTAALVVLMAPVVLNAAATLDVSPHSFMMAVAMSASSSFASPVSHPANVMVMGPGGYRFVDYVRVGGPLTAVVFLITLLLTPILWPLQP